MGCITSNGCSGLLEFPFIQNLLLLASSCQLFQNLAGTRVRVWSHLQLDVLVEALRDGPHRHSFR